MEGGRGVGGLGELGGSGKGVNFFDKESIFFWGGG